MKELTYKPLSSFADLLNGYAFKSKNYVDKGIRVVRIANVQDGYISDESPCFYPEETKEDISKYILHENDFLVSLTGNVGRVAILTAEFLPAALNQRVSCIRIKDKNLLPEFLFYYLLRRQFQQDCINASKGVAQLNLSTKWLEQYPIPVMDIDEQKRIVSKIEELFSELDNNIETLKNTKQQLAVYRLAVLKEVFGAIKKYVSFGEITESRLGKMLDREKNTGVLHPYLRNINVRWFSFDLSDLLEMRIEPNESEKYSVAKGDLIICEGGEPGRCAIWEQEETMFYQKALHRVRFVNDSNPKFYMYYLWFAAQTGKLSPYFTGMGIKHLTGQSLVKVPVPDVERKQQDYMIREIESRLSVCDSIEKTVDIALQQAEAMRQSVLKKAFEGNL